VQRHWISCQLKSGEWGYRKGDAQGTLAMTCGGVASLLVTLDWLEAPLLRGAVGREPYNKQLAAGLAWLEQSDHAVSTPNPKTHYLGYDLYGLERVALASGFKYFGKHDWYRELADKVVTGQWPNGAWGRQQTGAGALTDPSYALLL